VVAEVAAVAAEVAAAVADVRIVILIGIIPYNYCSGHNVAIIM